MINRSNYMYSGKNCGKFVFISCSAKVAIGRSRSSIYHYVMIMNDMKQQRTGTTEQSLKENRANQNPSWCLDIQNNSVIFIFVGSLSHHCVTKMTSHVLGLPTRETRERLLQLSYIKVPTFSITSFIYPCGIFAYLCAFLLWGCLHFWW